jgi:hypothetical protein
MADFVCKYCGKDLKNQGHNLVANTGHSCSNSPTGKHICVQNPPYCVYCGEKTHSQGSDLVTNSGHSCINSPNKKHQLDD